VTPTFVVHYQELVLKRRNRAWFIDRLIANLREVTAGLGVAEIRPVMGRIELRLRPDGDLAAIAGRLERTLGVASFSTAFKVAQDVDVMTAVALELVKGCDTPSFRVAAVRADKRFPILSPDLERRVGGAVQDATGWRVDLSNPALVVRIEIVPNAAYVSVARRRGPAGLPVGVSGRVLCLLSGGIDSPVAAFRLMRRGCRAVFVHFHSYPVSSDASREKVRQLVRLLTTYQLRSRLVLVPFGNLQRAIVVAAPGPLRVVIYRRFMMRIAERIASRMGARALVTGEAVGQVSSQTLENLAAVDAVTTLPVLRPLIGMDKEEITAEARRIGTLSISELPDEDCCQLFVPRQAAINVSHAQAAAIEANLPVLDMVRDAVAAAEREQYTFP
jgi:thiamine biosynthesis protein ThiI